MKNEEKMVANHLLDKRAWNDDSWFVIQINESQPCYDVTRFPSIHAQLVTVQRFYGWCIDAQAGRLFISHCFGWVIVLFLSVGQMVSNRRKTLVKRYYCWTIVKMTWIWYGYDKGLMHLRSTGISILVKLFNHMPVFEEYQLDLGLVKTMFMFTICIVMQLFFVTRGIILWINSWYSCVGFVSYVTDWHNDIYILRFFFFKITLLYLHKRRRL